MNDKFNERLQRLQLSTQEFSTVMLFILKFDYIKANSIILKQQL